MELSQKDYLIIASIIKTELSGYDKKFANIQKEVNLLKKGKLDRADDRRLTYDQMIHEIQENLDDGRDFNIKYL
ncbi:hypothetical protein J6Z48_03090 [bacterium]|nr:hypothetical protein [bacterium]